jgi:hypothetical protein
MSQRRIPSTGEVPHLVKEQLGELRDAGRELADQARNDPVRFLDNPITRLVGIGVGGVLAVWLVVFLVQKMTPRADFDSNDTPAAIVHVACTNPDCLAHHLENLPLDFDKWPLECSQCEGKTVYRAKRCPYTQQWYATAPGQPDVSPFKPEKKVIVDQPKKPTKTGDDVEDSW